MIIEAIQFLGDDKNIEACFNFCPPLVKETYRANNTLTIPTKEGKMLCRKGDWIIKEPFATADRQFYPCKPDIFEATYEPID